MVKYPDVPASLLYYVRPFQPADEEAVYALAADAYERTIDAPMGEFDWSFLAIYLHHDHDSC